MTRDISHTSCINENRALAAILEERQYQASHWSNGECRSVGDEVLLLKVLIDQAADQWAKEEAPEVETLKLLRKVAAIALRAMDKHGVHRRWATP